VGWGFHEIEARRYEDNINSGITCSRFINDDGEEKDRANEDIQERLRRKIFDLHPCRRSADGKSLTIAKEIRTSVVVRGSVIHCGRSATHNGVAPPEVDSLLLPHKSEKAMRRSMTPVGKKDVAVPLALGFNQASIATIPLRAAVRQDVL